MLRIAKTKNKWEQSQNYISRNTKLGQSTGDPQNQFKKKNAKIRRHTLRCKKGCFRFFFFWKTAFFYQNNLTKLPKNLSFKMDASLHCTLFLVSMSNVYLHVASSICQSHNLFDIFYDLNCFQILQWKKRNQSETN